MKFNGYEEPKPIPDMLISKNEVLMLIANYQMGTDPHSEIGNAQYDILEMLFRSVQSLLADRKTEPSNSEIPNNCEHITEDGVTCAKYPACDDCLDNPLNKVKGSERLVKGTEQTEPQYSEDDMYWLSLAEDVANGKMSDAGANQAWLEYINHKDEPTISKMEQVDKDINVRSKTEPQTYITEDRDTQILDAWQVHHRNTTSIEDEPQTDCPWK